MKTTSVLLQPVVSEKSFEQSENAVYTFRVKMSANKKQVAQEIEQRFKVNVVKVNMLQLPGKRTFDYRRRTAGKLRRSKKTIVTLKSGQTIEVFK
ncbi:MAG: 50S ribosomal protein L23 [Candidatus Dojkabacteria bacterium]|nr:50S ribosomal protein L23 [Candidatus Dojkabacteria bacterium]